PDLIDIECANILWKQIQRFGYPLVDAQMNLATLTALAVQRIPMTSLAADSLSIGANHGITAYDACYVAASSCLGVPLITADSRLVTKLASSSFSVLDLATVVIPPPP